MTVDLANIVSVKYSGDLVHSGSKSTSEASITVERLSELLVKINLEFEDEKLVFRGMLTNDKEGVLMIVQNRVTDKYIINGHDGFLYQRSNIHGGYLFKMNAFYFHLKLDYFDGESKEIYFLGKNQLAIDNLQSSGLEYKMQA